MSIELKLIITIANLLCCSLHVHRGSYVWAVINGGLFFLCLTLLGRGAK